MWIATVALPPDLAADLTAGRFAALAARTARDAVGAFAAGIARAALGRAREAREAFAQAAADPALRDAAAVENGFLDLAAPDKLDAICAAVAALDERLKPGSLLAARARHLLGTAQYRRMRIGDALDALAAAQALYRTAGSAEGEAQTLDTLGQLHQAMGSETAALVCYARSLALKAKIGDRAGTAITLGNLGRYCAGLGRAADAAGFLAQDFEIAEELGDARGQARVLIDLAGLDREAGDAAAARTKLLRARTIAAQSGLDQLAFEVLAELAITDHSAAYLEAARECAGAMPSAFDSLMLGWIEARLIVAADRPRAIALLTAAATGFRDAGIPSSEIEARLALAELLPGPAAEREILLALKRARAGGLTRYRVRIGETMERLSLTEGVAEETGKPIGEDAGVDGYVLRERLGSGSFATVWRAFDAERGREVALKILDLESRYEVAERERLLDSARLDMEAANRARHPGLVKVYAIGRNGRGNVYLAVEYIAGEDLRTRLESGAAREPRAICGTLADVAAALAALHGQGVVHRDLKPENIMLREDGSPVLVDFGIAHIAGLPQKAGSVSRGSPEYFSPEQGRGETPAPSDDMYALGVILSEWLQGVRPDGPAHRFSLFGGRAAPETPDELAAALLDRAGANRPTAEETARLLKRFAG